MKSASFLRLGALIFFILSLKSMIELDNDVLFNYIKVIVPLWFGIFTGGIAYIIEVIEKK